MDDLEEEAFVDYRKWDRYEELKRERPVPEGFIDLVDGFGSTGLAQLIRQSQDRNSVYSPVCLLLSVGLMMSSSERNAANEMRLQLERCAGAGKLSHCDLEDGSAALVARLDANPLADIRTACAAWLARSAITGGSDPEALEKIARVYGAEVRAADFGTQEAANEIKNWIAEKTNGMLKPGVQTSADQIALLVSCLYARLTWSLEFDPDETEWGDFFAEGEKVGDARFMHREFLGEGYCRGKDFTRVTLPCEGGCSADFLIPDDPDALLDADYVRGAFSEPDNHLADVEIYLPRFEIESDVDGKRLLNGLHMNGVFKAQDESPLVGGPMRVDGVVHGAKVKVDESGLEGAAYTMMPVCAGLPPEPQPLEKVTIRLDRPFAFRILSDDGAPLFMGYESDPTASARERFFENEQNRALRDDGTNPSERVRKVELQVGGYFQGWETSTLTADGKLARERMLSGPDDGNDTIENIGADGFKDICRKLADIGVFDWDEDYTDLGMLDGEQWSLVIEDVDGAAFTCYGSNDYPDRFDELCRAMEIDK